MMFSCNRDAAQISADLAIVSDAFSKMIAVAVVVVDGDRVLIPVLLSKPRCDRVDEVQEFLPGRNEFHTAVQLQIGNTFLASEADQRVVRRCRPGRRSATRRSSVKRKAAPARVDVNDHLRTRFIGNRSCAALRAWRAMVPLHPSPVQLGPATKPMHRHRPWDRLRR